jgi:putative ABC transport system permease protein
MSRAALSSTGLIQKGSTVFYKKIFKLTPADKVGRIESLAKEAIKDPAISISSHINANEANARLVNYLNDYLGLVSLIALLLASIGAVYLFRAHLVDRLKDIAMLKMVGLTSKRAIRLGLLQTVILGGVGSVLAILISLTLFPIITRLTVELLPVAVTLHLSQRTLGAVLFVGIIATALCVLPLMSKVKRLSARELFQEAQASALEVQIKDALYWLPFALFFTLLAIRQANSYKVAFLFIVGLIVAVLFLYFIGRAGLYLLKKLTTYKEFELKYALRELVRRPNETMTGFTALSLGAMMVFLIFSIEKTLKSEFEFGGGKDRPGLFLFDIQEDQLEDLKNLLGNNNYNLQNLSPLVRARLERVNGEAYERVEKAKTTREAEQSAQSRNRGFNLTERGVLSGAEDVVSGRYFSEPNYAHDILADSSPMPEISAEVEWAKRMGFKVGDILEFDVLGVMVKGKIVGLRRVRWASFQPNFFVQFQDGVFKDTPKSYLASLEQMPQTERLKIEAAIVDQFPNISILDVSRTVERILELATRMAWVLKFMALMVLIAALVVVWSIRSFHLHRNRAERGLLKFLGLTGQRLSRIESIEGEALLTSGVVVSFCVSMVIIWPLAVYVFSRPPVISWALPLVFVILMSIRYFWRSYFNRLKV